MEGVSTSTNMKNLKVLLYSDSREDVTQGLVLFESLVSNYAELVTHAQEITGTSSLDDALSAFASYSNGRDVVLWAFGRHMPMVSPIVV